MLQKEKKIVINAINELGRRVSAADIAAQTGLPLALATLSLNQIAAETAGHLQVSAAGDIAYQFPAGYQTAYISRGIRQFVEKLGQQIFNVGFFLLRISFGIMLILSLLSIVLIFFVIVYTRSRSDNSNDDFEFDLDFFDWMILRDLFFWQLANAPYDAIEAERLRATRSNFLFNCFSFLFGEGNPNADIDDRRWSAIAELIRQNQGAVISEQLAPYTGSDPKNEDAVLPVLVRFDGQPAVSEAGNIIYLFPSLQATAVNELANRSPAFLNELPWRFSRADESSLVWVIILAAVNFIGSWALYLQAANYIYFAYLSPLLLVLVIYGTLFVAIPIIRYFVLQLLNNRIAQGNQLRNKYAAALTQPDDQLMPKLSQAQQMALNSRQIKASEAIYDTQKDVLDQEFHNISNA